MLIYTSPFPMICFSSFRPLKAEIHLRDISSAALFRSFSQSQNTTENLAIQGFFRNFSRTKRRFIFSVNFPFFYKTGRNKLAGFIVFTEVFAKEKQTSFRSLSLIFPHFFKDRTPFIFQFSGIFSLVLKVFFIVFRKTAGIQHIQNKADRFLRCKTADLGMQPFP